MNEKLRFLITTLQNGTLDCELHRLSKEQFQKEACDSGSEELVGEEHVIELNDESMTALKVVLELDRIVYPDAPVSDLLAKIFIMGVESGARWSGGQLPCTWYHKPGSCSECSS